MRIKVENECYIFEKETVLILLPEQFDVTVL